MKLNVNTLCKELCSRKKLISTDIRHVGQTSDRIDQSQGSLLDFNRLGCDWSKNTMGRPVIQPWCGARNAGSQNGWKSSLLPEPIRNHAGVYFLTNQKQGILFAQIWKQRIEGTFCREAVLTTGNPGSLCVSQD